MRSTNETSVLFAAKSNYSYETLLPVMEEAQKRGYRAIALIYHPKSEPLKQKIRSLGLEYIEKDYHYKSPLPLFSRPLYYHHLANYAKQIFDELKPVALVGIHEKKFPEVFLTREGKKRNAPHILVQWAFTYPAKYYDSLREKTQKGRNIYTYLSQIYIDQLDRLVGINNPYASCYGGGRSDVFCVIGSHFFEQFVEQGVPRWKLRLTGHPFFDSLYQLERRSSPAVKKELLQALQLPLEFSTHPLILYTSQPLTHFNIADAQTQKEEVRRLVESVTMNGKNLLVIKLHPREDKSLYSFLPSGRDNLKVVRDFDLALLIRSADLLISRSSTTLLGAVALKIPIIILDTLPGQAEDFYSSHGAAKRVTHFDELPRMIEELLNNEALRENLQQGCLKMQKDFFLYDGKNTVRIMEAIEEHINKYKKKGNSSKND
jgi:hypothetical protein